MDEQASPSRPKAPSAQRDRVRANRIPLWIRPLIVDLGCCGVFAQQVGAPGYGLPGYTGEGYDLDPDQANVLIVAGRITPTFAPTLRDIYSRLRAPRRVIAFGTCAVSGTVFETVPTNDVIPVDVTILDCPPLPEALAAALSELQR